MRVLGCISAIVLFSCKPGLAPQETGDLSESDADTDTDADSDTDSDTDTDTSGDERQCEGTLKLGDTGTYQGTPPNPGFIMLANPLDSPSGGHYCADAAGPGLEADDVLQGHTCMPPIDNELFATDAPEFGQITADSYNTLCIEASGVTEGGQLRMADCAKVTMQSWVSSEVGEVHPADNLELCWVIASGSGSPAGDEGALKRPISIERCDSVEDAYKLWVIPCGNVGTWGTQPGK